MESPKLCTTRLLDQNFGMCITPQDLILPFYDFHGTSYFRPWKFAESANKDFGSTMDNATDKFQITLDVQHFRPNEVSVKVTDEEIIIQGMHNDRQDNHGFISRQFTRRYTLPKDYLSETVTSTLSSDGILTIMANKKIAKDIRDYEKVVPVKMCGPCPKKEEFKITTEMANKNGTDSKTHTNLDKGESQQKLKEDHCRLMKPELLQEAISGTEKLLTESRKETDELLKLISSDKSAQAITNMTSGKLDDVLGQCKTAIAELTEKINESNISGSSEMSHLKSSVMSETFQSEEMTALSKSSTSMSSTSSSMKTSERASELLMCAELKEAAEII